MMWLLLASVLAAGEAREPLRIPVGEPTPGYAPSTDAAPASAYGPASKARPAQSPQAAQQPDQVQPSADRAQTPPPARQPQSARAAAPPTNAAADESIYVVQRRAYVKRGSVEITPLFYTSLNNRFSSSMGPALALVYHARENLAFELVSSVPGVMRSHYGDLVYELYDDEQLAPEAVDLKKLRYFGAFTLQFSALYGKFDFFGHLIDYDVYGAAGPAIAATKEPCTPAGQGTCSADTEQIGRGLRTPTEAGDHYKVAGSIGGGLRLFFADWIGLRIELRDILYADRASDDGGIPTTSIRSNVFFMLGVSFLL